MVDGPLYQEEQVERTINQVARPWAHGRKPHKRSDIYHSMAGPWRVAAI